MSAEIPHRPFPFAPLIPEFKVADLDRSLAFYVGVLGFRVLYDRPETRFAFLEREGAQVMIEEPARDDVLSPLPGQNGRGMHLQIEVSDVVQLYDAVRKSGHQVRRELFDRWYRANDTLLGNRQFYVADPDGYLLRFYENLGDQPVE